MTYRALFITAVRNLRTQKRRSFLTMLGIMIGIMAVVIVLSTGEGAKGLILSQIEGRGTDQIAVLAGSSDAKGPPASVLGIVITSLTYTDGKALLDKNLVQHIVGVAGYISGNTTVQWQNTEQNVTYTGTTASYETIEKVTVQNGRFFTDVEDESNAHVVVLGGTIAEDLFGNQNPVGRSIKLAKKEFRVVGVLAAKGTNGFENPDKNVLIPLRVAQRDLLGVHHVTFLRMKVDNVANVPQTVDEVRAALISRHGSEDFSVRTVQDALALFNTVTQALTFFLVSVAGVALFVGGVGIMNIMLIAVKEKTREIGLRKAVGARDRDVLAQFLIETMVMTLLGAVIGIILGATISFLIALAARALGYAYSFTLSPNAILLSVGMAAFIGLVFGIGPARKAARLDPIEALRYE